MTTTVTILVEEIHCESCERTIAQVLSAVDGVLRLAPSAKTNDVKVSYDETAVSAADLRAKLAEVGYAPVG